MSSKTVLNPDASRSTPRSDISVPAPASSHKSTGSNNGSVSSNPERKRANPAIPTDDLLKSTIVVKPHPSNLQSQPRILSPLMLLPREHLALSSLDLSNPHGIFPASRFFESNIKILELEGRLGSNILLARSETNQTTYAIERESKGLYIVCKLGGWVDVAQLAQYATAVCSQRIRSLRLPPPTHEDMFAATTLQSHHVNKRRRLAIEELQSAVRKRPRSQGSVTTTDQQVQSQSALPAESNPGPKDAVVQSDQSTPKPGEASLSQTQNPVPASSVQPLPNEEFRQPTTEEIFQNIRTQYLDTLYHSMGSLAYFAKGPLSRARAAFHLDCDSNLEMYDLIEFLQGLVMTTVLIDKKYRETVPDIVSKMKTHIDDSDNGEVKNKKRKTKKIKLGKDGLYPSEDEHVRRWWAAHKPAASTDGDMMMSPQEIKYHISCLRRRETQLQMILMLEVLALEPLRRTTENAEGGQLPGMETPARSEKGATKETSDLAPKKRNKHNLPFLLDIHADRLCIWQTTTLDEVKALAESQVVIQGQGGQTLGRASSDPLKDFCVDIILPFFSARLPELCDSINRKLGGPVIKSPPKPRQPSKPTTSAKSKPGTQIKGAGSLTKKARERTLEEVLSKEKMRRSVSRGPDAVALLRSASVPFVPTLKREASEPALSTIPKGEAASLKERAVNVFGRVPSTGTEEQRAKKKAQIEAELQDAISALKRPNRALVSKEITDAAERRASTGSLKRLKKPNRPTALSAVQVKATPANNRFKDVIGTGTQADWHDSQIDFDDIDRVPSSASVVPSTVVRRTSHSLFGSAIAATPVADKIQATPARASSSMVPFLDVLKEDDLALPSSPIMARKVAPGRSQQLLSVPRKPGLLLPSSPGLGALFETPLKPRSAMGTTDRLDETPIKSRLPMPGKATTEPKMGSTSALTAPGDGRQQTIYQQLGWDDDDLL